MSSTPRLAFGTGTGPGPAMNIRKGLLLWLTGNQLLIMSF